MTFLTLIKKLFLRQELLKLIKKIIKIILILSSISISTLIVNLFKIKMSSIKTLINTVLQQVTNLKIK